MTGFELTEEGIEQALRIFVAEDREDRTSRDARFGKDCLSTAASYGRLDGIALLADLLGLEEFAKELKPESDALWKEALEMRYSKEGR